MNLYIGLLWVGLLIAGVANVCLIYVAFRESIAWGLSVLFVPFALVVFLFKHWDVAKLPFLFCLLGSALIAAPMLKDWSAISKQKSFTAIMTLLKDQPAPAAAPEQKPETPLMKKIRLEKMQAAFGQHAAELKAKYDLLQAKLAALPPNDKAARSAFDQELVVYRTMRKQVETEKANVEAMAATMK
jgi:hypothetical protein